MINYEREASDTIVLAGLTVTLPAFQRGQGTLAAGLARASRIRLELSLFREQALAELRAAFSLHEAQRRIADAFVRDAMASVADNESLGQRSFDAGEIDLMDLLLIRRDAIDTRRSAVERWLDAALSRLRVDAAAGVWR
jgi:cobalt-zinc-cadmium efflux system outer membrane protein